MSSSWERMLPLPVVVAASAALESTIVEAPVTEMAPPPLSNREPDPVGSRTRIPTLGAAQRADATARATKPRITVSEAATNTTTFPGRSGRVSLIAGLLISTSRLVRHDHDGGARKRHGRPEGLRNPLVRDGDRDGVTGADHVVVDDT